MIIMIVTGPFPGHPGASTVLFDSTHNMMMIFGNPFLFPFRYHTIWLIKNKHLKEKREAVSKHASLFALKLVWVDVSMHELQKLLLNRAAVAAGLIVILIIVEVFFHWQRPECKRSARDADDRDGSVMKGPLNGRYLIPKPKN